MTMFIVSASSAYFIYQNGIGHILEVSVGQTVLCQVFWESLLVFSPLFGETVASLIQEPNSMVPCYHITKLIYDRSTVRQVYRLFQQQVGGKLCRAFSHKRQLVFAWLILLWEIRDFGARPGREMGGECQPLPLLG